jgi:hypothetical protein
MTLTAFGNSSSFGTLNSWPQARHATLLSAAPASISQLLPHLGQRAIIRIDMPSFATDPPIGVPQATRLGIRQDIIPIESEKVSITIDRLSYNISLANSLVP